MRQTSFKPDFEIAVRGRGTSETAIEVQGELDSGTCEVVASGRPRPLERIDLELPRDPSSPARSREEVREALAGRERTEVSDVVLLVSEIVTNAVVHPRTAGDTAIGLRITTYADGLRVEVEDAGEGFEPSVPVASAGDRGRGLFLVDSFANRWGAGHVETDAGRRFRVWFELEWSDGGDAETAP